MSKTNSGTNAVCDNYYVKKMANQIVSDSIQMNIAQKKEARALNLVRQGIYDSEAIFAFIDTDTKISVAKNNQWNKLDMYLKWQAIESFLAYKNIEPLNYPTYKLAFQKQIIDKVEYDNENKKILKLNYNGI